MKIVQSVKTLYDSKLPFYNRLGTKIDGLIKKHKDSSWHYVSRIKAIESFALKIETGRFNINDIFEDFFACTIVVKNLNEINRAISLVDNHFIIIRKKPESGKYTHKETHSFQFDDLRLICQLRDFETGSISKNITNLAFEIQIKTFLQHAWGIATHDLIYKSNSVNWGKERVAYQVKAALEQAEVLISGVAALSTLDELNKNNKETSKINKAIRFLNKVWSNDDLPADKKRLAQNIIALIENLKITFSELNEILSAEKALSRGSETKNLSPYLIIIQSIYLQQPDKILSFIRSKKEHKIKLLLTSELNLPIINRLQKDKIVDLRT